MSEWQPITTAPKDGSTIIGWGRYETEPVTVMWNHRRKDWDAAWDNSMVLDSQTDFGSTYKEPGPLSHWMPLPEPPKATP